MADSLRALAVRDAFVGQAKGRIVTRGTLRLIFDELPKLVLNTRGEVVGVDVMVRLFDGLTEVRIDPHRVIINPPTVPRANLTYIDAIDNLTHEIVKRRIVGAPDPGAALIEALWDSVLGVPNAKGWRTRGTVTTFYGAAGDGHIRSYSTTYATARAGGSLTAYTTDGADITVGQDKLGGDLFCNEGFVAFDTSGIGTDTVSAAVLSLWLVTDSSSTDFTVWAAVKAWLAALTTADWVAGASLAALTSLASIATSGIGATGAYKALTSEAAFPANINKTGNTEIILYSSRHSGNNAPTGSEYVIWQDADYTGTTQDPKLVVTHEAAAAAGTMAATLTKATASLTGAQAQSGVVASTLQKALANLLGAMQPSGIVAAELQQPTMSATGAQTFTGTLSAVLQALLANASGAQAQSGAMAAALQRALFNATGVMLPTGTIVSLLQVLKMSATGAHGGGAETGTIAASLQLVVMAATGLMQPSGTLSVELQRLIFSGAGEQTILAVMAVVLAELRMNATGDVAAGGMTGTLAASLQRALFNATAAQVRIVLARIFGQDSPIFRAAGFDEAVFRRAGLDEATIRTDGSDEATIRRQGRDEAVIRRTGAMR